MAILNSEVNYDQVLNNLSNVCLGETACNGCNKEECVVGYAQKCVTSCFKNGITFVENGKNNIPLGDMKIYEEEKLEKGIAHILKQCRSCKENHFDNCIINVIRNCYEVGLFGDAQPYEGSNFRYLNYINTNFPDKAPRVLDEFHSLKDEEE